MCVSLSNSQCIAQQLADADVHAISDAHAIQHTLGHAHRYTNEYSVQHSI